MKKLVTIILFLICFVSYSQSNYKNLALTSSLSFASGLCDGTAEHLKFHYTGNSTYWNPNLSWTNKWKNGDPLQGERFWQSSRALVWTTDGYHLMRHGRNIFAMSAIVIHIGEKKKWYLYGVDYFANFISYTIGFTVTYELLK
jgi:hypothetical protein